MSYILRLCIIGMEAVLQYILRLCRIGMEAVLYIEVMQDRHGGCPIYSDVGSVWRMSYIKMYDGMEVSAILQTYVKRLVPCSLCTVQQLHRSYVEKRHQGKEAEVSCTVQQPEVACWIDHALQSIIILEQMQPEVSSCSYRLYTVSFISQQDLQTKKYTTYFTIQIQNLWRLAEMTSKE